MPRDLSAAGRVREDKNLADHLHYIEQIATVPAARQLLAEPTNTQVRAWAHAARLVAKHGYKGRSNTNQLRKLVGVNVALRTKAKIIHNASKKGSRGYGMLQDIGKAAMNILPAVVPFLL